MLVLALVVGAEGVALSTMADARDVVRVDPAGAVAGISASAVLLDAADRQQSATLAQTEAAALAEAHTESGSAKVQAALAQAEAAAERVRVAEARREQALRNVRRDPRSYARMYMADRYGWGSAQFSCLDRLWIRESQWNYQAENPSSGAYGIPQSLPGNKMASVGSDWRTNPVTQMQWGLGYISDRYGTPCAAWAHSENVGWY